MELEGLSDAEEAEAVVEIDCAGAELATVLGQLMPAAAAAAFPAAAAALKALLMAVVDKDLLIKWSLLADKLPIVVLPAAGL